MSASDDPKTFGRARLSFASETEIDEFAETLARFERGEIGADEWRAYRLVRGTYGQRQADDANMIRVKIPQGAITSGQLRTLADVADRYSRGFGHITTRENVQFHFVRLHDVELAMRDLAEAGITTREACGNSIRNVTACPYAGAAADEAFDVTPYAEALTRHFLRHPLSAALPRKFKIAFEGCPEDHAKTSIHDIGWRAVVRDGERGFRVTVGGGTATLCTSGHLLFDFMPVSEMLDVAEAIVRAYHRRGDFQHKQRNRMKFLIRAIGWEAYRAEFDQALSEVRASGGCLLPFDPAAPPVEHAPTWSRPAPPPVADVRTRARATELRGPGIHPVLLPIAETGGEYARWRVSNVLPQRDERYVMAIARIQLGDVTAAQFRVLADLAEAYADGAVRFTPTQNLVFRWVDRNSIGELYARLAAASLGLPDAERLADVTSCPGAESCKLAVTQSRGLGRTLGDHLLANPAIADLAPGLDVKISGCPNGCGQHHIAGIGFQGSLRKVEGRAVPQYFVMVGGGVDGGAATFGRVVAKIPARRCAAALDRLLQLYTDERSAGEDARSFFRRVAPARIKTLLADLETMTAESAEADDYIDLGEQTAFVPETMEGECSA